MGQKTHPYGFRLGIIKTWDSKWFASKSYAKFLYEDIIVKKYLKSKLQQAGISKIEIERAANKDKRVKIKIYSARPGLVIGRKGAEVENLKKELQDMTNKEVVLNITEVKRPEVNAQLVAENVALQLERRVSFRRAMKRNVSQAIKFGAKGIKAMCSGRLAGAEMARTEWYREGRVPLQTIRADIDYGFAISMTKYGVIGVKVWIFKGEVFQEAV
ncbi:MAG TPA: 30S ribosomal protein S3 [Syntrophorhabdaceae bacterium]|nr:30S ribosomal protein S3 [Syntrophorhabdaceae bacterium]